MAETIHQSLVQYKVTESFLNIKLERLIDLKSV